MNNLTSFFGRMTLKQAWENDDSPLIAAGMTKQEKEILDDTVDEITSSSLAEIYGSIEEQDTLFNSIYGLMDKNCKITYPFVLSIKRLPEGIQPVHDEIGVQTSKYHKETLRQHLCIVAKNLIQGNEVGSKIAAILAVLHDIGKKYTAATNKIGEICFYNHATVSAYLAANWLKLALPEDEAKVTLAAIYGHMEMNEKVIEEFKNFLPEKDIERAITLTEALQRADKGITEEITEEDLAKIDSGESEIVYCRI